MKQERVKWQIDCDEKIKDKENVIFSSPTGSGKTGRYEEWAFNKMERPIFITSPIKALSNQKFRDLESRGYKVGLETGDIKYIPEYCEIVCCTQEIYNNKYRNVRNSTLVIDEFSYIFDDKERARAYIDSLFYSEAKNIMICSATFGNPNKLKSYLDNLTNRNFYLYVNKKRLTTLEYKGKINKYDIKDSLVVAYSKDSCINIAKNIYIDRIRDFNISLKKFKYYYDPRERFYNEILKLIKKYKINNEELIELAKYGVVYYYGSLLPKEKLFIEELFENRLIDTVVGTDALALGVNFPVKNVVFTQLSKFRNGINTDIGKNLFEQLSGRAGRKGYFDNGYVFYCDDFYKEFNNFTKNRLKIKNESLEKRFFELVKSDNEDIYISLLPNIKDILENNTTIEEEAWFISKYSTENNNFEDIKKIITNIVEYIKNIDISYFYLKKLYCNLNFDDGYYSILDNCSEKTRRKIEELSYQLTSLQTEFENNIGNVYLIEYSVEKNCSIFIDILLKKDIKKLIKKHVNSFYDLLLFRKYMYGLPEKYLINYNLSLLDEFIDEIDYTVLHPEQFKLSKKIIPKKQNTQKKVNQVTKCPYYFDIISIEGKEYIKILMNNDVMLVCEYSKSDNLQVLYFPSNTIYKLSGLLKPTEGLKILKRLDLFTLQDNNDAQTIDTIKVLIKNKYKQ